MDEVIALIKKMMHDSGEKGGEHDGEGGNNNDWGNSTRCTIVPGVQSRSAIRRNIYSFQYIGCISCVG